MIFDVRTYRCRPGTIDAQLDLYREYGWETQCTHLGKPAFYAFTETGELNTYIHAWAYENAADREQRRAAMHQDPNWHEFIRQNRAAGNLVDLKNAIMQPPSFFDFKR